MRILAASLPAPEQGARPLPVVSRCKVSISHCHLDCLVPRQFGYTCLRSNPAIASLLANVCRRQYQVKSLSQSCRSNGWYEPVLVTIKRLSLRVNEHWSLTASGKTAPEKPPMLQNSEDCAALSRSHSWESSRSGARDRPVPKSGYIARSASGRCAARWRIRGCVPDIQR